MKIMDAMPPLCYDRFRSARKVEQTPASRIRSAGDLMDDGLRELKGGDVNAKMKLAAGVLGVERVLRSGVKFPEDMESEVYSLAVRAGRLRLVVHEIIRSLDPNGSASSSHRKELLHPMALGGQKR